MLDIKHIRENPDVLKKALKNRNYSLDISPLLENDRVRRGIIAEVESLKEQVNKSVKEVSTLKKEKKDASLIIARMQEVKKQIQEKDALLVRLENDIEQCALVLPNVPDPTVPVGQNETQNVLIREEGNKKKYTFKARDHVELGGKLDILDFETAAKLSGSRFALLKKDGAKLERALINFMVDLHTTRHGYTELWPPFLVTPSTMQGTGQLPKFEEELFKCRNDELYLIPTAEVPLTAIHRDEILPEEKLPIKYVAYTACFRREAGSYGKDTRGLIRNHQFNKVELVKLVKADHALVELEKLLTEVEAVLKALDMPYRVIELCTGDLGFSAAKTYDLEVWMPGENRYREVSSCSLFTDFQARRLKIRYRASDNTVQFVHTLNASGVAVGRLFAALLENGQCEDGSVMIPAALQSYMNKQVLSSC